MTSTFIIQKSSLTILLYRVDWFSKVSANINLHPNNTCRISTIEQNQLLYLQLTFSRQFAETVKSSHIAGKKLSRYNFKTSASRKIHETRLQRPSVAMGCVLQIILKDYRRKGKKSSSLMASKNRIGRQFNQRPRFLLKFFSDIV